MEWVEERRKLEPREKGERQGRNRQDTRKGKCSELQPVQIRTVLYLRIWLHFYQL